MAQVDELSSEREGSSRLVIEEHFALLIMLLVSSGICALPVSAVPFSQSIANSPTSDHGYYNYKMIDK